MIEAIIFDVGGVLVRTEEPHHRAALEKRLGLAPGAAEHLVFNSEMGRAAQLGQISSLDLWQWVREHLALDEAALAQFQTEFFAGDRLDHELLALIHGLRPRYRTAIISNYKDDLHHLLSEIYPMAGAFDLIVGSAYEKVMKPDPAIFTRTLARLQCHPAHALFVDDFPHNVEGAGAVGMHAIHFSPEVDLQAELVRHGVVCWRESDQ